MNMHGGSLLSDSSQFSMKVSIEEPPYPPRRKAMKSERSGVRWAFIGITKGQQWGAVSTFLLHGITKGRK
jgi:hypothetical protein